MIRAPSPNPPGDERAVADLVTGHLRSLGVTDIERVGAEEHRPNLIVRVPGAGIFQIIVRGTQMHSRADIEAFLAAARRDDPDLRAELDFHHMIDACEIDSADPVVAALQSAAAQVLDDPPALDVFPGATDAPHFQLAAGIPTVAAFGPGMLFRAHSPNERLAVSSVAQAARIYTLAALDYLG